MVRKASHVAYVCNRVNLLMALHCIICVLDIRHLYFLDFLIHCVEIIVDDVFCIKNGD